MMSDGGALIATALPSAHSMQLLMEWVGVFEGQSARVSIETRLEVADN